ncbi:hypothetical protein DUNSADRAFT_7489 [Dunaliella salina]|uniref:Encoded protein n=1 Tax=Dunaliella salina TaxID=3046 RepID=A0ABQ7FTB7_DUNSA|nr:hypothetical protein DUNSADRAFT_7489 [Dunaliella salina]|eukprot:KAF5825706.1 hypothetical protein DUNSADRAFT_7489 [Dunaliella salina]
MLKEIDKSINKVQTALVTMRCAVQDLVRGSPTPTNDTPTKTTDESSIKMEPGGKETSEEDWDDSESTSAEADSTVESSRRKRSKRT